MKKFRTYFLIVILLLLGLFAVGVLYLFFVPNSSLFGICYVSLKERVFSEAYSSTTIDKIVLNSRAYETSVVASSGNEISVMVYANNIGFVLTKNKEVKIDATIENNCLTFNISEPYGACIISDSKLVLKVPTSKAFDINLSNKSASTTISESIKIDDLTYSTSRGNLALNNVTLTGTLDLTLNNATMSFGDNVTTNNNNINLNINSGKFDATKYNFGDIYIEKNEKAVLLFGNVNKISANLTKAGGRIEADTIGTLDFKSSDTNVYLGTLTNGGNITLTNYGQVRISSVNTSLQVSTNTGEITIGSASSPLSLNSTNGNVTVNEATSKINATTTYGNINVTFADSALSYAVDNLSRQLVANSYNGKISCTGADNVAITASNKARVELTMHDVLGENIINGANGSVYIKLPSTAQYKLITQSNISVDVNLTQMGLGGYTTGTHTETNINGGSSTNSLTATTNKGYLTIRDDNTVNY